MEKGQGLIIVIIVSAIIGSGYAAGMGCVSRSKMLRTIAAWVASFALAFGLSYGTLLAFRSAF